ncbi:SRPBCC domain-containing protein [Actinosynnema sp. NPDC023587]|uniref:SRPBCC domain-containing protein n=1 Tax=Actinosynnema sp. NPDC023587 TaxID=3154695 RepID=UPI003405A6B1
MSETVKIHARVTAPVSRVRRALTAPDELGAWLAEHVAVELPDRYQFWGRHTPEGDAPHQELEHVDDTSIRFTWHVGGEATAVGISLAPDSEGDGDTTIVTVSQSHFPGWESAVAERGVLGHLYTFWCLALANLVEHVDGRPLTPRCDFTTSEMRASVEIDGPRETVYRALTDAEEYSRWFGAKIDIEPWEGGRVAMGGFDANPEPGKVVDLVEGERMTIDWGGGLATAWELEGSGGKTRLTFVQSGFMDGKTPYGAWTGWLSGVAELRRYVELGSAWTPIWLQLDVPEGMLMGE